MLEKLLADIGLTPEETKIYLFLLEAGPNTVGTLATKVAIPRPSLYGLLKKLQKKGMVVESLKNGVKLFSAEPYAKIEKVFDQQIELLENKRNLYKEMLPEIERIMPSVFLSPKFQLYEGNEGVKHVLKDM